VLGGVKLDDVPPEATFVQLPVPVVLCCHWYDKVAVPVAETDKAEKAVPLRQVLAADALGCAEMEGEVHAVV